MSMIKTDLAGDLVIRDFRSPDQWPTEDVQKALDQCIANDDLNGAESIFMRLDQEHIVHFDYKFRNRPPGDFSELGSRAKIVNNCKLAWDAVNSIRSKRTI